MVIDTRGPFNDASLIQYEKDLELCIHNLESSTWNQIVTLHQFSLFTPEAERILTRTVTNRHSRGLVACAIVLINIEGESLIKPQMSRCYN